MADLDLNIKNGFSFVFPTGVLITPPTLASMYDGTKISTVHRAIASGGTPPYKYNIIGPNLGFLNVLSFDNRPGIGWYNEYADLTIKDTKTFALEEATSYSATIVVTDSAGTVVSRTGDIVIAREPPVVNFKDKGKLFYGMVSVIPRGTPPELTVGYYLLLSNDTPVSFEFEAMSYQEKLNIIVLNKPRGLTLTRPDTSKNQWFLEGVTTFNVAKLSYFSYYVIETIGSVSVKHPVVSFPYYQVK